MDIFASLKVMIENNEAKIQSLKALFDQITNHPQAFDDEDKAVVQEKIQKLQKQTDDLKEDLDRRQNTYESTVLTLEKALHIRQTVLESVDDETGVLRDNKDLMSKLADKQAGLVKLLNEMKDKLIGPYEPPSSSSFEFAE